MDSSVSSSAIVPLYKVEPYDLDTIRVAAAPLPLAQKVVQQSLKEFCEEVAKQRGIPSFQFSENIYLEEELRKKISGLFQLPAKGISMDPNVISSLVVCDSGKLNIGRLLYTSSEFNRGQPMLIYSGQAVSRGKTEFVNSDDYEFKMFQSDVKIHQEEDVFITARKIGGFAGFMQDLVDPIDAFTREGSVAQVNLLALPFILHGIGNVLFIATRNTKGQLGYSYGVPYWATMRDKKIRKVFMDCHGGKIAGMLLEEKQKKVRLLKALLREVSNANAPVKDSNMISAAKRRSALLLAVVPREIIDALNDAEQQTLHTLAPSFDDIPDAADYSSDFTSYGGYDAHYFDATLLKEGKASPLSALNYMKTWKPSSRQSIESKKSGEEAQQLGKRAVQFFTDGKYGDAIQAWEEARKLQLKLNSHHGVIYFAQRPIPLHGDSVKAYWNMGNAFLKDGKFLDAFECLRIAVQVQSYLDKIALTNKTLEDMSARLQESFNRLRDSYTEKFGIKIVAK